MDIALQDTDVLDYSQLQSTIHRDLGLQPTLRLERAELMAFYAAARVRNTAEEPVLYYTFLAAIGIGAFMFVWWLMGWLYSLGR